MPEDGQLDLNEVSHGSRIVDERALALAPDEQQFVEEAHHCLAELHQSVAVVAGIHFVDADGRRRGMTRDEAIVAGTVVRVSKLHEFLIDPMVCAAAERFWTTWRSAAESCVNAIYLIRFGTRELFDEFVLYSFRLEKKLLARVQRDVDEQATDPTPLQRRMLQDIPDAFIRADVDPLEVDEESRADWSGRGGIFSRFNAIGWEDLYALFQIASHYTHGNWHDLSVHHLGHIPGIDGYQPALELSRLRPQPLTAITRLLVAGSYEYLVHVVAPSEDRDVLADRIVLCGEKAEQIDVLHERWLAEQEAAG